MTAIWKSRQTKLQRPKPFQISPKETALTSRHPSKISQLIARRSRVSLKSYSPTKSKRTKLQKSKPFQVPSPPKVMTSPRQAVSQIAKKDASSKWQKNRQPQSKTKASELVALRRKCKDLRRQLPSKRPSFGPKRQRQPTIDVNQDVAQRLARMNLPLISKQDSAYLIHESSTRFIQATRSSSSSHSTSSAAAEVVFSVFSTFD